MGIRAVCFDLAGVLCRFDTAARWQRLGKASGLRPDDVQGRLSVVRLIERADSGELTCEQEFELARNVLSLSCEYTEYRAMWCAAFEPVPEVLEIVQSVQGQVVTAILTNNGPILLDALSNELAVVSRDMNNLFVSAQFGATKPDARVYQGVADALAVPGPEIVLVDDTIRNVVGAVDVDWQGIHFVGPRELTKSLGELGITA